MEKLLKEKKGFIKNDDRIIKFPEGKTPPHSMEAERYVLGALLLDNPAIAKVGEILSVKDFYNPSHQTIYSAIIELSEKGSPFDLLILSNYLKEKGLFEKAGDIGYLSSLLQDVATSVHIEHYARIVRQKALRRKMIESALEVVSKGFMEEIDVEEYLDHSEQLIYKVNEERRISEPTPIRKSLPKLHEQITKLYQTKEHSVGIPTGFRKLDQILMGLQNSDLVIIAARPGMGKTSFAMNMAVNSALNSSFSVVFFSLEMGMDQILTKIIAMESQVDSNRVRQGMITDVEYERINDTLSKINPIPLYIDDSPKLSIFEVRSKARRMKMEDKCDILFIDYLQLMESENKTLTREQQVSEISRSLKALAKELNIPVVALSQLNRSPEGRTDKRPILSDLRESGAIEQDADVVIFIYRDDYYNEKSPDKGIAEILVEKQRNGPTGKARLAYIREYSLFHNLYEEG